MKEVKILKKVGIIIPHYNSVDSAIRLLNSIYQTRYLEEVIETVIIDDRSTDNIELLQNEIESFKNARLLINDSPNKGAGASRNIGIDNLTCEWLLFADADDYFENGFESNIRKFIDSDVDLVYFNCISREEFSSNISNRHDYVNGILNKYMKKPNEKNEDRLKFNWVVPWGKLIRNRVIKQNNIRFDEIMVSNDVMFSTKLALAASKLDTSSEVLYCVTKSSGSLTTSYTKENYSVRTKVMIEKYKFLKNSLESSKLKSLDFYCGEWLVKGYKVYKLNNREIVKYYCLFKNNGIPFLPPITKLLKINKFIKNILLERKFNNLFENSK